YTPTLVPPDGLFEPPYPNEAPSFPIFEDVFAASGTLPLEMNNAPIVAAQQYSPPRTTPQTTTTTTATLMLLSAHVNKTKPKMSKLSSRSDVVAVVRDDGAYLPNVDQLTRHLNLPVMNTFFSTNVQ
ncbi:hypothetical protein TELCIR_19155, partial [Teladorsagia circumcincta]